MENKKGYLERITRLAGRNKDLKNQLKDLIDRYMAVEGQNEQYEEMIQKYSDELSKKSKTPKQLAKRLRMVSVLYVSVKGFDRLYTLENPDLWVDLLDELYISLDEIAHENNMVKVRSIGDIMLFAAGLSGQSRTNPIDIVLAALKMEEATKKVLGPNGEQFWKLKMGIHTGPVVATLSEGKSIPFSLTGDSVNIASRIGEATPEGTISSSIMTYELIKDFFECRQIGIMPAKYKGNLGMFEIQSIGTELQEPDNVNVPNEVFKTRYRHSKFMEIQEELLDYLEQRLPQNLYYHNIKHTIDVITEVELIGWAESVSSDNILLLKLAALFHDAGHITSYKDHEFYSANMAREKLTAYNFTDKQIETVCRLIMATKTPPQPKDLLEQIICDSDLDYLGRIDFLPVSNTLYEELKERDMIGSWNEWNRLQLKFISNHQYFTKTAVNLREVNKQQQIERLEQIIVENE
ncbi:MAG: HD domain-containing protein [Cytophagaceae bacterium]|jgi:class 3 adenylate cyclase|nr:HD domain-containing protein [Cytophagaceae bacterium]